MATIIKTEYEWQAQVWAREKEADIVNGTDSEATFAPAVPAISTRALKIQKKVAIGKQSGLKGSPRTTLTASLLGEYTIADITLPDLVAWRDMRVTKVKPASLRREMNLLKTCFRHCR